jgi:hypothetical protein
MLSILATEISEIREIDINPIFVSDKGIAVADARIMLK